MASFVGRITSLTLRRLASCFTSFITGSAPVPVPITSLRHSQGIFSFTDNGVCPKASRNFLDAFFLRLRISPRSITTSCSYVVPSIRIEPKENFSKRMGASVSIITPGKHWRLSVVRQFVKADLVQSDVVLNRQLQLIDSAPGTLGPPVPLAPSAKLVHTRGVEQLTVRREVGGLSCAGILPITQTRC